jgi:stress-induced morphogen
MDALTIESLIREALPGVNTTIENLRRDGESRFLVRVHGPAFEGKTRLEQHRMVYAALRGASEQDFETISLSTGTRA